MSSSSISSHSSMHTPVSSPLSSNHAQTHLPPPKPDLAFTLRPSSKLGVFLWKQRMWVESTFVFSMLEPWEKVMLLIIYTFLFLLLFIATIKYLPHHLYFLYRRAVYYLSGQESDEGNLLNVVWQWASLVLSSGAFGGEGHVVGIGKGLRGEL